jgi:hypothetical protein
MKDCRRSDVKEILALADPLVSIIRSRVCMCGCEREMLGSLETVLSFAPLPIIYRRIPWARYFFNESVCSIF